MNGVSYTKTHSMWALLKVTYGLLFLASGIDKFFNGLTYWAQYLNPTLGRALPILTPHLMRGVGILEIIIGVLILTKWTKTGAYLAMTWLLIIVVNLITMHGFYDIAIRDTVLAIGAYVLAQLSI